MGGRVSSTAVLVLLIGTGSGRTRRWMRRSPVGLEELGEVFACLLQLVLVQDDVKHLL